MSEIHVKDGESIDSALKRFKRSCAKAGTIFKRNTQRAFLSRI